MIAQRLVERYAEGAFTAEHLFVQCLALIDPADPGAVLTSLPGRLLDRFRSYVNSYQPTRMVTSYGELPTREQVEAAAHWLGIPVQPVKTFPIKTQLVPQSSEQQAV